MSELKEKIKAAQIDLIKDLGIDKLEPEQREKILMQIGEIVQQRIVLRIVEELPENKQADFKTVIEKAQEEPAQLDEFLNNNLPNLQELILDEIGEYKKNVTGFLNNSLKKSGIENNSEKESQKVDEEQQPLTGVIEEIETEEAPELEIEKKEQSKEQAAEVKLDSQKESIAELKIDSNLKPDLDLGSEIEQKKEDGVISANNQDELRNELEGLGDIKQESKQALPKKVDDRSSLNFEKEIEQELADKFKPIEKDFSLGEDLNVSEIEKEQAQDESKIVEENRVDKKKEKVEELDLSEVIEE